MRFHPSLGAWRNRSALQAARLALDASEPLLGALDPSHMQVCPQNPGLLDDAQAQALLDGFPQTCFRLHANAHALGWSSAADASTAHLFGAYFDQLGRVARTLKSPAYTWHAGLRRYARFEEVLARTQELEQRWGIPVGVEGLYPTADDRYVISSWDDYARLLASGVRYAIDLSHLHIVREHAGREHPANLVRELLSSPQCLEIHVSANDGAHDMHAQIGTEPWWWSDLRTHAHHGAQVFTEGGQVMPIII